MTSETMTASANRRRLPSKASIANLGRGGRSSIRCIIGSAEVLERSEAAGGAAGATGAVGATGEAAGGAGRAGGTCAAGPPGGIGMGEAGRGDTTVARPGPTRTVTASATLRASANRRTTSGDCVAFTGAFRRALFTMLDTTPAKMTIAQTTRPKSCIRYFGSWELDDESVLPSTVPPIEERISVSACMFFRR
jgi:hypothetical protein